MLFAFLKYSRKVIAYTCIYCKVKLVEKYPMF